MNENFKKVHPRDAVDSFVPVWINIPNVALVIGVPNKGTDLFMLNGATVKVMETPAQLGMPMEVIDA